MVPVRGDRIDGSRKYLLPGLAEMHGHTPGGNATEFRERLIICLNPRLGEERRRKRELLAATGETRERIAASVRAGALAGKAGIGRRIGCEANRRMAGKRFGITIEDGSMSWARRQEKAAAEARFDGVCVVRTSLEEFGRTLPSPPTGASRWSNGPSGS